MRLANVNGRSGQVAFFVVALNYFVPVPQADGLAGLNNQSSAAMLPKRSAAAIACAGGHRGRIAGG
jgi:hypothetical protein